MARGISRRAARQCDTPAPTTAATRMPATSSCSRYVRENMGSEGGDLPVCGGSGDTDTVRRPLCQCNRAAQGPVPSFWIDPDSDVGTYFPLTQQHMNMNALRSTAILAAVALAAFSAAPRVHAQADLEFAGGDGAPLVLTLDAPVTYLVTTASTGANGPGFDFQGVGDVFPDEFASVAGSITFTIDGGPAQSISTINSDFAGGALSATDVYIFGAVPGVAVGDTVVLNAGSLTTASAFSGALPASGSYQTFLFDESGAKLDAMNGTSVPEPSAWTLLLAGASLAGLMLKRRAVSRESAGAFL